MQMFMDTNATFGDKFHIFKPHNWPTIVESSCENSMMCFANA